jgi:iron complex transport system ATP-binding protein
VLRRIRALARDSLGVIMTTHDPNQAYLMGGKTACIARDGSFVIGQTQELLTPGLLRALYDVEVSFATVDVAGGRTISLCAPLLEDL